MAWIWEFRRRLSLLCVATGNVRAKLKTEILRHTLVICLTICRPGADGWTDRRETRGIQYNKKLYFWQPNNISPNALSLIILLLIMWQSCFPFPWWWFGGECYGGMLILRLLIIPLWERIQCTLWWISLQSFSSTGTMTKLHNIRRTFDTPNRMIVKISFSYIYIYLYIYIYIFNLI